MNQSNDVSTAHPDWMTAQLRFTAFVEQSFQVPEIDWWAEIVGTQPESITTMPKVREINAEGNFGSGRLLVSVNPVRIDLRYSVDQEITDDLEFSSLGELEENLNLLVGILGNWFGKDSVPPFTRLAFGTVLLHPVPKVDDAYTFLKSLLHFVQVEPGAMRDLTFQVNRQRVSQVIPGLLINRLSRWASLRLQSTLMKDNIVSAFNNVDLYAVRLILDINTIPENKTPFSQTQLLDLFNELVGLGREIIDQGDIK